MPCGERIAGFLGYSMAAFFRLVCLTIFIGTGLALLAPGEPPVSVSLRNHDAPVFLLA